MPSSGPPVHALTPSDAVDARTRAELRWTERSDHKSATLSFRYYSALSLVVLLLMLATSMSCLVYAFSIFGKPYEDHADYDWACVAFVVAIATLGCALWAARGVYWRAQVRLDAQTFVIERLWLGLIKTRFSISTDSLLMLLAHAPTGRNSVSVVTRDGEIIHTPIAEYDGRRLRFVIQRLNALLLQLRAPGAYR